MSRKHTFEETRKNGDKHLEKESDKRIECKSVRVEKYRKWRKDGEGERRQQWSESNAVECLICQNDPSARLIMDSGQERRSNNDKNPRHTNLVFVFPCFCYGCSYDDADGHEQTRCREYIHPGADWRCKLACLKESRQVIYKS